MADNGNFRSVHPQTDQRGVALIGASLDLGAGRRGVDMGPSAIRYAGLASRIGRLGLRVHDLGNVEGAVPEATAVGSERVRFLEPIKAACERIADLVARSLTDGLAPLVLGGDHSVSIGTLGGVERVVRQALSHVAGPGFVHVSLDMDALDPEVAPGVGTPVRGGLSYREAHLALELVAESGLANSLEVVEVNPILDRENETAELAVELVASALGARIY